jgi:hypothetical protein
VILFKHNYSILIQSIPSPLEELYCIFISQVGKYPLDPDHIVFLGESEVLQSRAVKVTGGGAFKNLAGFGDVFLALVDNVHLVI